MHYLLFAQVITLSVGIVLIYLGYRRRKSGFAALWLDKPWSRSGFNPLWPFGLTGKRDLWVGAGFRLHILGLMSLIIGVMCSIAAVMVRWL